MHYVGNVEAPMMVVARLLPDKLCSYGWDFLFDMVSNNYTPHAEACNATLVGRYTQNKSNYNFKSEILPRTVAKNNSSQNDFL